MPESVVEINGNSATGLHFSAHSAAFLSDLCGKDVCLYLESKSFYRKVRYGREETPRHNPLWLNPLMFARRLRIEYEENGRRIPCPLKWLDSFSMRNFTNATAFDDTLPLGDGLIEVGTRVPLDQLKSAMEDWFRRKSYLPKTAQLIVRRVEEAGISG